MLLHIWWSQMAILYASPFPNNLRHFNWGSFDVPGCRYITGGEQMAIL
jgi:hypothetical protein